MKVTTTLEFLRQKAHNMHDTLLHEHKANANTMNLVMNKYFNNIDDISKYAAKLRGQSVHDIAKELAIYIECPDEAKAAACIRQYLECFQAVTDGFTY